jgi:hypothetical protein
MSYLEQGAAALAKATEQAAKMHEPEKAARVHLEIAQEYARLAAIERGLHGYHPITTAGATNGAGASW